MATPYQDVYNYFLPKITNYSFLNLTELELNDNLETLLNGSINKFKFCKVDLYDRDVVLKQFNNDLSEFEKDILATLMVIEYLLPKLVTDDLLQQTLGSKDYRIHSKANHIKEIRELRDSLKKEVNQLMIDYSYKSKNMDDFL